MERAMIPKQVAERLGVSDRTIHNYIRRWKSDFLSAGVLLILPGGGKNKVYRILDYRGFLDVLRKKGMEMADE